MPGDHNIFPWRKTIGVWWGLTQGLKSQPLALEADVSLKQPHDSRFDFLQLFNDCNFRTGLPEFIVIY
jgi:hypothetical protein